MRGSSSGSRWTRSSSRRPAPEPTLFLGHQELASGASVLARCAGPHGLASELAAGERGLAIFDQTPFYAEGGGQVGDTGEVTAPGLTARVLDTQNADGAHVHVLEVTSGVLQPGDKVELAVDAARRRSIMREPLGHPPAARGAARGTRRARPAGRVAGRPGPAALRLPAPQCARPRQRSTGWKGSLMLRS